MTASRFFCGDRNTDGRKLEEILGWSDAELEGCHDVVQWCFPLHEPSSVNADAPVVTEEERKLLAGSPKIRWTMRRVLERWLGFYGFELRDGKVVRGEGFEGKVKRWNWPVNHNHLRITRIIRSLRLFGLEGEAREVFEAFAGFARSPESRIGGRAVGYWEDALEGELFGAITGR